jgi:hypothetical protein
MRYSKEEVFAMPIVDEIKVRGLSVPGLEHYRERLEAAVRVSSSER